jgi:hypothetical protein
LARELQCLRIEQAIEIEKLKGLQG